MDNALNDFALSITSITDVVKMLRRIEEQKAAAAAEGQHGKMDGFLKQEQVYILKLRGLEQSRIRAAENLGFGSLTFREILSRIPEEQEKVLRPLFHELDSELRLMLDAKDSAERMITSRLAQFRQILSAQGQSYDENGSAVPVMTRSFHDRYV